MTETVRRFPRTTRVAVVAALLGVVSLVSTGAGAAPPTKEDVERAKARLEGIEGKLSGIQRQLAIDPGAAERGDREGGAPSSGGRAGHG